MIISIIAVTLCYSYIKWLKYRSDQFKFPTKTVHRPIYVILYQLSINRHGKRKKHHLNLPDLNLTQNKIVMIGDLACTDYYLKIVGLP